MLTLSAKVAILRQEAVLDLTADRAKQSVKFGIYSPPLVGRHPVLIPGLGKRHTVMYNVRENPI